MNTNDEDMLAGPDTAPQPESKPAKPVKARKPNATAPPTAKQAITKKAKATVAKQTKPVMGKPRRVITPGVDKPPTLTHKQTAVLSALSQGPLTALALCTAITGNDNTTAKETFQKTTLGPLVKDGLVVKLQVDSKTTPEYSNDTKKVGATPAIKATLDNVPLGKSNAISAGFLGGLVFGKPVASGKRDLWRNVRHGRAVAAILKRLIACGAVGVCQPDSQRAKLFYRNPAK
jgi:hypothetical protein